MGEKKKKKKKKNAKDKRIQHRKYLEEIGIRPDEICVPMTTDRDGDSQRFKKFMKERAKYGFDSRETWCLEYTASVWLYEHLCMYLECADKIVDLTFHSFDVPTLHYNLKKEVWNDKYETWYAIKTERLTQKDCIELCLTYLDNYLYVQNSKNMDTNLSFDNEQMIEQMVDKENALEQMGMEKQRCAFLIFAEILPAMWW